MMTDWLSNTLTQTQNTLFEMINPSGAQAAWWHHEMEIFSVLLALCEGNPPVTGDAKLWCFFDLRLHKRFTKQSTRWWFEMPLRSLWRHCKANYMGVICYAGPNPS